MSLIKGNESANTGMSKAIYEKMDKQLSPPLQEAIDEAEGEPKKVAEDALKKARINWKKLSYAIAYGVIDHIRSNMVIQGVTTSGNVNTSVNGETAFNVPGGHKHGVALSGTESNVEFTQNNDGTGLVD